MTLQQFAGTGKVKLSGFGITVCLFVPNLGGLNEKSVIYNISALTFYQTIFRCIKDWPKFKCDWFLW